MTPVTEILHDIARFEPDDGECQRRPPRRMTRTLAELRTAAEPVLPEWLPDLFADVLAFERRPAHPTRRP